MLGLTPSQTPMPVLHGYEFEEQCLLQAEMGFTPFIRSTPGTGKTSKAKALAMNPILAEIMGYKQGTVIPHALIPCQQATEESINGFPVVKKREGQSPEVDFAVPKFYTDEPMLLILDEGNRAKSPVASALFPLLTGDPMINGWRLHPLSLVILLGNDWTHHAGVKDLDRALKGRISHYAWIPVLQDWIQHFALPMAVDPTGIAYLEAYPEALCRFDPTGQHDAQPSPRTWYHAFRAWASPRASLQRRKDAVVATVGPLEGNNFLVYAESNNVVPTPQEVEDAPDFVVIPKDLNGALMMARSMGHHLAAPMDDRVKLANGATRVLLRMSAEGYDELVLKALTDAIGTFLRTKQPVRFAIPSVQALLQQAPHLSELLVEVGRAQMAGAGGRR